VRALSLFSGAGGADLGITEAGIEVVRGVEHDADAVKTCRAAGLDYVVQGDVRDLSLYDGLGPIDLLFGGPPCQAFSTAGKRKGQDDDRNGWPWTLEVIDHVKPRWVLLENVPGLLCHSQGCAAPCPGCCWRDEMLPAFRARFPWADFRKLNASSYGVPQHRRRVFLVAGPRPIRWPDATHGDPAKRAQGGLFGRELTPWVSVGEALGIDGVRMDGGRNSSANPRQERPITTDEPSYPIGGRGNQMLRVIGGGRNPQDPTIGHLRSYRDLTDEPSTPIPAVKIGNAGPWVCPGRRRLTVAECATLQDFPAGYLFQGTKTAQYRQVGNAWPRTFGRVLGAAIADADDR